MTEIPVDLNAFNRGIVDEFHANDGVVGGPFEGATLLLLHTTGAKSGESRLSPLAYLTIDDRLLIIGAYAGAPNHPAWVHNLRVNPSARIEVGTEAYEVIARELPADERAAVLPKVAAITPTFAQYQAKTTRIIPVFDLQRV